MKYILFKLLLFILTMAIPSLAVSAEYYDLSVKNFKLSGVERVVGYKLKITSGRISALKKVPIGWNVTIDNDPSWNTTLTGSIIVAAAAIKPNFFDKFVQVEKFEQDEIDFDLMLEIITTSDFEKETSILLDKKLLLLTPINSRR